MEGIEKEIEKAVWKSTSMKSSVDNRVKRR